MKQRRLLAAQTLLAALIGLLLLLSPPAGLQRAWLDLQLRWAAPPSPPAGVLVLDIDDASLELLRPQFGSWPLPRDSYALLIEALRDAGARAIAIDLLLSDPRDGDAALARSLARDGAPVVLAAAGMPGVRPRHAPPPPGHLAWAQFSLPATSLHRLGQAPRIGIVTTPLDADGKLRHWWLQHSSPQGDWPLLPLAVLQALQQPQRLAPDEQGRITPLLSSAGVRSMPLGPLLLAAREGRNDHQALRAVQGQVVFIGASSLYSDAVMTPLGQQGGSMLLAQAYAALRDGLGLRALPTPAALALLAAALLPVLPALRRRRTAPLAQLGASLLGLVLLAALMAWLCLQQGYWLDPTPVLATLASGLLLHVGLHALLTQREAAQQRRERDLAEAANQAKSAFLANVSHELRTPLSALLGLSELLAQGPLNDTQRRQVQLLGSAGRSLLTLIDELLDLSRVDMGRLVLHPQPARLRPLLDDCVALMQARAAERQVQCELVCDDALPDWVQIDAQRLSQVLLNLIGNAIKFTPQGRVSLRAARLADGRVQFSVSDTGIGIASSQLQRIFEPFLQAQGQDAAQYGGTGLGLAISRQLVRLMGGDIEVHSVPGAGSRFAFALALQPADAPVVMAAPAAPVPEGLQLLLAEDDDLVAEVLQAQLQPLGLQIERAANGHLALALAKRMRFDLVLLDLQLPGLDGLRVARSLREHERERGLPRTPVVALSAHAFADDARLSLAAGCDEHLSKPVGQQRLLEVMRRWLPQQPAPRPPPASPGVPAPVDATLERRRAHAQVFLGHWGGAWAAARDDATSAQALLRDLLDCAEAIEAPALRAAAQALLERVERPAPSLLQQAEAEQAVQARVEGVLLAMRRAASAAADAGDSASPAS